MLDKGLAKEEQLLSKIGTKSERKSSISGENFQQKNIIYPVFGWRI